MSLNTPWLNFTIMHASCFSGARQALFLGHHVATLDKISGWSRPEKSRDPWILQNPVPEIPGLKILDPAGAWLSHFGLYLFVSQQQIKSCRPTAWKINWPGLILEKVERNKTRQERHKKSSEIPSLLVLLIWFVIYTWHWAWGEASTRWLSAQTAVVTTATTYSNATAEIVHGDHTDVQYRDQQTYIKSHLLWMWILYIWRSVLHCVI